MLPRPLPREVVRDLLGITRALFRAERAKAMPDPSRLARLEDIGKQYRRALDMAGKYGPDTMGGRAAFNWAEKATAQLGQYVADCEPIALAVAATATRLKRGR
jgi:hypothetical protein